MTYSEKTVYEKGDIDTYAVLICGGNQIWNMRITERDSAFFGDFTDTVTRKVAYAVSLCRP